MKTITLVMAMAAMVVAMVTTADAGEFLIDLASDGGSAAGWDVFTGSVGDTSITDQDGLDNDVTLSIGAIGGTSGSLGPGTGATIDTVTVPKEAHDDYFYGPAPYTGTTILFEFKNLDAGTYNVSVFQGRVYQTQYGKIWAGVVGDEPGAQNTGDFAGGDQTVEVTISAGESVFYLHLEDNGGGTSGIIVRQTSAAPAATPGTLIYGK